MAVDIIARAMAAKASSGSKDVDYDSITNKPQINGVTLEGDKTTSDLGINEIIELVGTEENPIELANIGEPGIYKISGNVKALTTSNIGSFVDPIILVVAKSNDSISQHYWEGNTAFRMKVRVATSGIPFTENFHELSQEGTLENYSDINAFKLISSLTLSRYLGRGYMGKILLSDLKTTDKNSLINAINELVDVKQNTLTAGEGITIENNTISSSGSGGGAFPIIDATGDTEIDLDDYLDDGTWIIKGHNVKQIKEYGTTSIKETDWAILEIKTQEWLSNGYVYQVLQFPMMAYNNGGLERHLNYGVRQIKPNIVSYFTNYAIPVSLTNYYDSFPVNGYETVLSAMGSYNMYTALMSYLTDNVSNKPRLSGLNTTDKSSLVAAINELAGKIPETTGGVELSTEQNGSGVDLKLLDEGGEQLSKVTIPVSEAIHYSWDKSTGDTAIALFQDVYNNYKNGELLNVDLKDGNKIYKLTNISQPNNKGTEYWCQFRTIDWYTDGTDMVFLQTVNAVLDVSGDIVQSVTVKESINQFALVREFDGTNGALPTNNTKEFTPQGDYEPATKKYVDETQYKRMPGWSSQKTQVLKNINGVLTWVSES